MNYLNQYTDIYDAVANELDAEELIEILSERELSLEDVWSLSNLVTLSIEYDHLKDDE